MTGPGRPSTGVRVDIRIPAHVLAKIDDEAAERGTSRADMIRRLIDIGIDIGIERLAYPLG